MVSPDRQSEKAISGYSEHLVKALKKNKVDVDFVTYKAGSLKSCMKLFKKFKEYDIVHIQHEYNLLGGYGIPFFILYLYLYLQKELKVITTMHTALPLNEPMKGGKIKNFCRKVLYFTQNRFINHTSDLIFVHANFFVPVLVNEYHFPREKIVILPQGIVEGIKITPKEKAKKELSLKGPVYLIIGNLHYDNGADIILRNADKIGKTILVVSSPKSVNDRNQARLAEYLNELQEIVKKNKFEKYVRFDIAKISDKSPKWWKYFSASDFVLQAYRGGIGSGIVTHSIAAKTPIISSDIQFFKEIEKKYGCMKTVMREKDYASTIKECLKPKNYNKMVRGCEKYLKDNSWNAVTKRYKKIYKWVLE